MGISLNYTKKSAQVYGSIFILTELTLTFEGQTFVELKQDFLHVFFLNIYSILC